MFFALSDGEKFPSLLYLRKSMQEKTLSIFVDESGVLQQSDDSSRFYVLTLVFHDQSKPILDLEKELVDRVRRMGIERMCFHAGPVIRQTDEFSILNWEVRNKIFAAMMGFARKADFCYHCLVVDKFYTNTSEQIVARLEMQFNDFWQSRDGLREYEKIKVYYDCGQAKITNLLHRIFSPGFIPPVEFVQGVRPSSYRMFQLADMICSLRLIEERFKIGLPMTPSEYRFFGADRKFKRDILRRIKIKEI